MAKQFQNIEWSLPQTSDGNAQSWQHVEIALLMDIRRELQTLNRTMSCYRVQQMADSMIRLERRIAKKN